MKFALIAFLALSSQAFSAEYLVKYSRGGGFAPIAMRHEVTVLENGKVVAENTRGTVVSKTLIATLSQAGLQNLKDKIEQVPDSLKLEDLDPNRGRCMDAPSSRVTINKGGKEIQIASVVSCKRYGSKDTWANELSKLADSFVLLSK